jgi:DNA-binding transcriptional regulator YhcF (GntR family)
MVSDPNNPANVRRAIAERFGAELEAQNLPAGTRLKSIRALASEYGVSYVTMRGVLLDLQKRGVVTIRRGSGIYAGPPEEPGTVRRQPVADAVGAGPRLTVVVPEWYLNGRRSGIGAVGAILSGVLMPLYRHTWHVEIATQLEPGVPDVRLVERILASHPHGVAWIRPYFGHHVHMMRLKDRGVLVCSCGRRFPESDINSFAPSYEEIATLIAEWCDREGVENVALLSNLTAGSVPDSQAVELLRGFDRAFSARGRRLDPDYVYRLSPPLVEEHVPPLRAFLDRCRDARVFICMYQHHIRYIVDMMREGVIADPGRVTIIDLNLHYDAPMRDFGGARYIKVLYDHASEGLAMARFFEERWLGDTDLPEPDLSASLQEYPPEAVRLGVT